jgi:peroxiredoxin
MTLHHPGNLNTNYKNCLFWVVFFITWNNIGLAQSKNTQPFYLSGQLPQPVKGNVSLLNQGDKPVYSTVVTGTRFVLKGSLAEPGLYYLKLDTMATIYPIFMEGSTMQINIQETGVYQVKGSALHDQYEQYMYGFLDPIRNQLICLSQELGMARQKGDTLLYNKLRRASDSIGMYWVQNRMAFVTKKPHTYFNLHLLKEARLDDSTQVKILADFRPALAGFPTFKQIEQNLNLRAVQRQKIGIGRDAYSFTLPDSSGIKHSLVSLRKSNKLILLDFWASWCGPCIQEFPNLMALQKKYASQGLQVVGISVDSNHNSWVKALEKHTPIGLQLLSTNKGLVYDNYAIQAVPQTILIDQDGRIIGTGLQGEALAERVATALQEAR